MQSAPGRHIQSLAQGILRGFLRGVLRAWVLVVPLVLALSLIRLGQIAYFWPTGYHVSTTDLASVVVQGFRFDLKVSAVAGFLLLLVLPWVSGKVQGRIAMGVSFLYVMLSLVNLHYFGFTRHPLIHWSLVWWKTIRRPCSRPSGAIFRLSGRCCSLCC
jgi:hypothetical protein